MRNQNHCRHVADFESLEARVLYSIAASTGSGETATAQVTLLSTAGSGSNKAYNYDVALSNIGAGSIGTFWFAWIPARDFMKSMPASISGPAGWPATITGGGDNDGYAIRWVAAATSLPAGTTLTGFKFSSADSPTALAGNSTFFSTTPVETSFVYGGAPFSDAGYEFVASAPTTATKPPGNSFLAKLSVMPMVVTSTIPANGDVNPYGVAIVPNGFAKGGSIAGGDVLASNFNDADGLQGTGSTIVSISQTGQQSTFYQGSAGLGLTTALSVLRHGFVLVGNVPAPDGANVDGPGSLLVLDKNANLIATLDDPALLNGPWDMTVQDRGNNATVYISNVLDGTVTRVKLLTNAKSDTVKVLSKTQIANGYAFGTDPAALVVGPTGLAFGANGNLYVASTGDNAIYAIPNAAGRRTAVNKGRLIVQDQAHLRGPLALTIAGNNLITANGDAVNPDPTGQQNSELVEYSLGGKFLDEFQVDPTAGGAFGLAFEQSDHRRIFAAVDDVTNVLDEWIVR